MYTCVHIYIYTHIRTSCTCLHHLTYITKSITARRTSADSWQSSCLYAVLRVLLRQLAPPLWHSDWVPWFFNSGMKIRQIVVDPDILEGPPQREFHEESLFPESLKSGWHSSDQGFTLQQAQINQAGTAPLVQTVCVMALCCPIPAVSVQFALEAQTGNRCG